MSSWTGETFVFGDATIEIEGIGKCDFTLNGRRELVIAAVIAYGNLTGKNFQKPEGKSFHDYFKLVDIDHNQQKATFRFMGAA